MVTVEFQQKLLRSLEMYLLKESGFALRGIGYELILFVPTTYYAFDGQNMLIISAKLLDNKRERTVLESVFSAFKSVLSFEEFSLVSSIKVIGSNSALVKRLNLAFPSQRKTDAEYEVNSTIEGIDFRNAKLVRTSVLSNLVEGRESTVELASGRVMVGKVVGVNEEFRLTLSTHSGSGSPRNTFCPFADIVAVR